MLEKEGVYNHMRASEFIIESPDFGYSHYNNREDDLKNVDFEVWDRDWYFVVNAVYKDHRPVGFLKVISNHDGISCKVAKVELDKTYGNDWVGTGLGQLLYEKAIEFAKKHGYKYLFSDYKNNMSLQAINAWKRLSKRFSVISNTKTIPEMGIIIDMKMIKAGFAIDLSKINSNIAESPDFGYSQYNDREYTFKKLSFEIKKISNYYITIMALFKDIKLGQIDLSIINNYSSNTLQKTKIIRVQGSEINPHWKGTGLGQTLYDKAIKLAQKNNAKYFQSDSVRSPEAESAWKKLSQRYPVTKIEGTVHDKGDRYQIDLSKVTLPMTEGGGYIPQTEEEANDPRYKMAITCDIKPGEDVKQAAKFNFKLEKGGIPPLLKSNGKITESPDFGYTRFSDRDKDLESVMFEPRKNNNEIVAVYNGLDIGGVGFENVSSYDKIAQIFYSQINRDWYGSGLGQILYDYAIQLAKMKGYKYLNSDTRRSTEAERAWKRLAKRYPVTDIEDEYGYVTNHQIDLTKIPVKISEPYGKYKKGR